MPETAEVLGEEFKDSREFITDKIRNQGNENLASIIETTTPQKLAKEDFIQGLKTSFPEHADELLTLQEEIKDLQEKGQEAYDITEYFEEPGPKKFVPKWLADDIEKDYNFVKVKDSEELFVYKNGYYQPKGEQVIKEECETRLGEQFRAKRCNEVIEQIEARNYVPRKKFQPPKRKINLANGVYDLKEEELLDHSPKYYFTHIIPHDYNPNAECQKIHSFLNDIVRTEEQVKTLKEIAGYCLLPDYPIPKAFMLLGKGNNGKSRYIDLLRELIGEQNLVEKGLQDLGERFGPRDLPGKLACVDDDLSSDRINEDAAGMMKKLTGGSRMGAEEKFGAHYSFYNHAKLVFACNELPKTVDDSDGFFRRWMLIEFPFKFKQNPDSKNKLEKQGKPKKQLMEEITTEEELEGFLWWSIENLKDVLKNDEFTYAPKTQEARNVWREYSEPLVKFIHSFVKQGKTRNQAERESKESEGVQSYDYDYVRKDFLHYLIGEYCKARSHSAPSKKAISKELEEHFYVGTKSRTRKEPENRRVRVYSGIKVDYPDPTGCPGVPTYSELIASACACAHDRSKQSVDVGTPPSGTTVRGVIEENSEGGGVPVSEIAAEIEEDADWVEGKIEQLCDEGKLYEVKPGRYDVI